MKQYIIICKPMAGELSKAEYVFATREIFDNFDEAVKYADGVATEREAMVVESWFPIKKDIRP